MKSANGINRKLSGYVNYLIDNDPSPFCDYIICKELLRLDAEKVRESYEWAKRFTLYTEIRDEQFPDGSWGDFWPMDTSPQVRKGHRHTNRATMRRLRDLSLDINDEMVAKTAEFCRRVIRGELTPSRYKGGEQANYIKAVLYSFAPDDELVASVREEKAVSEEKQRAYMVYEWDHGPFGIVKISEPVPPGDKNFVFWMCGLENLMENPLFGEFMATGVGPYLYSLCERLVDPDDGIQVCVNRYFNKVGQYSESWSNNGIKKKDLLLRIIRVLNKCG